MTMTRRLISLQSRKQELESQIHEETIHPAYNFFRVAELKKRKLIISDQISQLANSG